MSGSHSNRRSCSSCRRSSNSCGEKGEKEKKHSRMHWSSAGSKSCWKSNGNSNNRANSWKSSSSCHRMARAGLNRHRRRGGGFASLRPSDPYVAPPRGACDHPGRARAS
jgi:hypothetical protein